ncbi:MAG: hypothetical protein KDD37_01505 [Bdellovibrionales bacterium]|nr:hypothetical protein [Bdellovibrionales bacterium]
MEIKFLLLVTLAFSQGFRNSQDRKISSEVVESFSKQCAYISTIESNIVKKLEEKLKLSQSNDNEVALSCYRDNLTQISSAHFIYSTTCKEVSVPNFKPDDSNLMRIFVAVQKYRKGIRLQHSILNDCLRSKKVGTDYIVDLEFNRIESDLLRERLEDYKVGDKFTPNRTTYR